MSRRKAIVVGGVVVVLIAVMVAAFFATHERQEVEVDVSPDPEARANPYLGVERFFEQLEIDVAVSTRPEMFSDADVIFASAGVMIYDDWRETMISEWLTGGGRAHLVLVAEPGVGEGPAGVRDHLEMVDYDRDAPPEGEAQILEYDYDPDAVGGESWTELLDQLQDDDDDEASSRTVLGPADPDLIGVREDDGRLMMISAPRYDGRVTVIPDGQILTNRGLEGGEVGLMLADLLGADGHWPREAHLFLGHQRRGWLDEVWTRGWPFFAGLALMLIAGLSRARRFGPPIPEPKRRRRRRGEHIGATGRFLWDHGAQQVLVEATRRALVTQLQTSHPSLKTMDDQRRLEVMAAQLDVSPGQLRRLMECPIPDKPRDVQDLIAELEQLRRKL